MIDSPSFPSRGGLDYLPRAKAASSPAVGRIVDSGREIHARVGSEPQAFAELDLNLVIHRCLTGKLKHPGKLLP